MELHCTFAVCGEGRLLLLLGIGHRALKVVSWPASILFYLREFWVHISARGLTILRSSLIFRATPWKSVILPQFGPGTFTLTPFWIHDSFMWHCVLWATDRMLNRPQINRILVTQFAACGFTEHATFQILSEVVFSAYKRQSCTCCEMAHLTLNTVYWTLMTFSM